MLKIYGILQKYIYIFQELYANSRCCVKAGSGTTDFFRKEAGVQCYCNGLLTKVMSSSRSGIIWQEIKPIDLDVADDLALLTKECKQVQLMTESLTN